MAEKLLTAAEVAKRLGMNKSAFDMQRHRRPDWGPQPKKITSVTPDKGEMTKRKKLYFTEEEVDRWIKHQNSPAFP